MKKNELRNIIIALLTVLCMAFAMTSCGKDVTSSGSNDVDTQITQEAEASEEGKNEEKSVPVEKETEKTTEKTTEKATEKTTEKPTKAKKKPTQTKATKENTCRVEVNGKTYKVSVSSNDTAYSVLKKTGVSVSARNSEYGIYVEGINGKFEFDEGPDSGWMYSVNGVKPKKSAGKYSIKKGDKVKWYYTTSY